MEIILKPNKSSTVNIKDKDKLSVILRPSKSQQAEIAFLGHDKKNNKSCYLHQVDDKCIIYRLSDISREISLPVTDIDSIDIFVFSPDSCDYCLTVE